MLSGLLAWVLGVSEMICRCSHEFHAPSCYVGTQHSEGLALCCVFQCPACRTTVYCAIWESDDYEQLVSDTAPMLSAARDTREEESHAAIQF